MKMKAQVIEIISLVIIIIISLMLMSNSFNKSIKATLPNIQLEAMTTCLDVKNCIANEKIGYDIQKGFNLKKEIKSFVRKRFYG